MDKKTLNLIEKAMKIADEDSLDFELSFYRFRYDEPKQWHITFGKEIEVTTDQNLYLGLKKVVNDHRKRNKSSSNREMRPCG